MHLLYYSDLDYKKAGRQFDKVVEQLARSDFRSADVKKMPGTGYYRARLDKENRLLFRFSRHGNRMYLLLLEVIYNHEYHKSRFLRGAKVDEAKFLEVPSPDSVDDNDIAGLNYVNPSVTRFHLLDKVISFDEYQEEVFRLRPPVIIIGSAGSGKTVLTLEKLKTLKGRVLYVTLSPFLVENSSNLYYSWYYENEKQEVDFLSYTDYCSTLRILQGHEMDQRAFEQWMQTRAHVYGIKDVHKLFEEFRGVLTGMEVDRPYLSRDEYIKLGVRRSIFLGTERNRVYDAFEKYLEFLQENGFYDQNIISYEYLKYCKPVYDFVVIDEAQDFTNIQLFLILNSLREKGSFILCGDSNQIVHPNFFSWTNVKSMFYKQDMAERDIKVLRTNYRNSLEITTIANRLLKVKNARFGSIDKESTYLIEAVGEEKGEIVLLKDSESVRRNLNDKTFRSTKFAVLVMKKEDKSAARKIFRTPLLFSIHESKGLEYENVILLDFISGNAREFNEIVNEVNPGDLDNEDISYARYRDKTDKTAEALKFYINSLYVAITRGVKNIYLVESNHKHRLLQLLRLVESKSEGRIAGSVSSKEEWKREADRLEKQGKKEHADEIRKVYFSQQTPDWEPVTPGKLESLKEEALNPDHFNKKAKDLLFAYAMLYEDMDIMESLSELKYRKAERLGSEHSTVIRKYYLDYKNNNVENVARLIGKYGVNYRDQFNLTPLLAAIHAGSNKVIPFLLEQGADVTLTDNRGRNALRMVISQKVLRAISPRLSGMVLETLVSDSLRLKIDDRLVIIPSRKFEYLLVNLFLAITKQYFNYDDVAFWLSCINAKDIEEALVDFPEQLVPDFRKKRTYISAMLAKNERSGSNPYNNKILIRMSRGEYLLNPDMEMMVNDRWMNVYKLMDMEKPEILPEEEKEERIMEDIRLRMAAWQEERMQEQEEAGRRQEETRRLEEYYGFDDDDDDDDDGDGNGDGDGGSALESIRKIARERQRLTGSGKYRDTAGESYRENYDGSGPSRSGHRETAGSGYNDPSGRPGSSGEQAGDSANPSRKRKPRKRTPDEDTDDTGQLKLPF